MSGSTKKCNDLVTQRKVPPEKKMATKNFKTDVRTFEKTLPVPDGL